MTDVDRLRHQMIGCGDTAVIGRCIRVSGDDLIFLFGEDDADVRDDELLHISGGVR